MKGFTKYLIGVLATIGIALQSPDVQLYAADALRPLLSSHPNLAAAVGVILAILLAAHNPGSNPNPPPEQPSGTKEQHDTH